MKTAFCTHPDHFSPDADRMLAHECSEQPPRRETCPDCGYHGGQHGEDCHADEWTESELRAAAGDR